MSNSESLRAAEAEILAAFERFDVNRDGRISEAEFVAILTRETSQRASLSPDKAKRLFAKADLDRAGHVGRLHFAERGAHSGELALVKRLLDLRLGETPLHGFAPLLSEDGTMRAG